MKKESSKVLDARKCLLDYCPLGVLILDGKGNILEHNKKASKILKRKVPKKILQLNLMVDGKKLSLKKIFKENKKVSIINKKEESLLSIDFAKMPNIGNVLFLKDYTKIYFINKILFEKKRVFETTLDNIQTGIWLTDKDDKIIYVNKVMAELSKINREDIIGLKIANFKKNNLEMFLSYYKKAKKILKPVDYNLIKILLNDGTRRYQSGSIIPRINNKKFNGNICIVEDLTQDVLNKTKLKTNEKKLNTIIETAADTIIILDIQGNITHINKRIEKVIGFKKEKILDKNFMDLDIITPESKEIIKKNFMLRIQGTNVPAYEIEILSNNKKKIPFEVNANPLLIDGKIVGTVAILRDISERINTKKRLDTKIKELEMFNKFAIGREMKMIELKKKIKKLQNKFKIAK